MSSSLVTMSPSLVTIARRAFSTETKLPKGSTLLLAVSGGPDSMALLDVTARVAKAFELVVHAHGVDHGLREEASSELDLAEAHAMQVGVPFDRTRVHVEPGENLQARARAARFSALATKAASIGAAAIATAHHADDRAETLLLRLLRGAGPRGLAVLPPRTWSRIRREGTKGTSDDRGDDAPCGVELVRPLLRARKEDVLAHLSRHGIPFAEDPSNANPRFLRVRVRRTLMPLLEELSPQMVRHLEALADQLDAARSATGAAEAPTFPLSRETERALKRLAEERSPRARVWLPGGLVALTSEAEAPRPQEDRRKPKPAAPKTARAATEAHRTKASRTR